jgi:hypothetical protein
MAEWILQSYLTYLQPYDWVNVIMKIKWEISETKVL